MYVRGGNAFRLNLTAFYFFQTTEEQWNKIFDVNVTSSFLLAKDTVPHLLQTKGLALAAVQHKISGDLISSSLFPNQHHPLCQLDCRLHTV